MDVITTMREIVKNFSAKKIDGVLVDVQSANAVITVYDALSESRRARYLEMEIGAMTDFAWRCVK